MEEFFIILACYFIVGVIIGMFKLESVTAPVSELSDNTKCRLFSIFFPHANLYLSFRPNLAKARGTTETKVLCRSAQHKNAILQMHDCNPNFGFLCIGNIHELEKYYSPLWICSYCLSQGILWLPSIVCELLFYSIVKLGLYRISKIKVSAE